MADKSVKLKLTLSDGRIIESNAFTLPQGPAGATGPAGPATLPNYVSFEKPTNISINESGSERTVTGVAEWEANGAMESGEYHILDEEPLIFTSNGIIASAPVVGSNIILTLSNLNREPHLNEYCAFITQDPAGRIYASVGQHSTGGTTGIFQFNIISVVEINSVKMYLHNISGNTSGAFAMSLQVVTNSSAPITTVEHLKKLGIFSNQNNVPASGCALQGADFKPAYCLRYVSGNLYLIAFNGVESPYQLNDSQVLKDFVVEI